MWTGDLTVRRVRVLLDGLMWMPDSTVRRRIAAELSDEPDDPGPQEQSSLDDIKSFLAR